MRQNKEMRLRSLNYFENRILIHKSIDCLYYYGRQYYDTMVENCI